MILRLSPSDTSITSKFQGQTNKKIWKGFFHFLPQIELVMVNYRISSIEIIAYWVDSDTLCKESKW